LIVTQYIYPETFIINDLVIEMKRQGNEVTVLTGKPNYPDGNIFPGYVVGGVQKDVYDNDVEVIRIPLWLRGRGGAKNLILNYLSFMLSGCLFGPWLLKRRRFDVIFVFEPSPITVAFPAIILKMFKRIPIVLWVQDLWPQSLVVTKFVENPVLLKIVEMMVWFIYRCCDKILVQSRSFIEPITKVSSVRTPVYYPNSFKRMSLNKNLYLPDSIDRLFSDNFTIVFAGNIGKAQSVETILSAAKKVEDLSGLKIVLVGSGSMLAWVQEQIKSNSLNNIECLGRFDYEFIPLIYSRAKVLLLTLNSDEILTYTLPWKTQSYLAAGKPILGAIDGEGARVIRESECGLVGPAENSDILEDNIRKMYAMADSDLSIMGQKGLRYFEFNFEMESQVRRLIKLFAEA